MPPVRRVLVIDDEVSIQESLAMFLSEKGLTVFTAGTGNEGVESWRAHRPHVIILDLRLPDVSGLDVLRRITDADPDAKVIMITAHHDMETTIQAMRQGAYDYIHKPLDVDELDRAVTMSLHITDVSPAELPLVGEDSGESPFHSIVGRTPAMRSIFKTIGLLARNRATVLIQGETGTGKDLIARVIHESSSFKDQPYVTVDCTTLVENLLESELFGHERGAFTGAMDTKKGRLELAGEGTVFFDEIGDLPPPLQSKLLRFLEHREFRRVGGSQIHRSQARIIAATNRDLSELVSRGKFRSDLHFRLKVINIHVPPLRNRMEDMPEMVRFLLARINRELHTKVTRVEKRAMERMAAYSWPGNIRELKNALTKAALESRGTLLLAHAIEDALSGSAKEPPALAGLPSLEEVEKQHVLRAMAQTGWNLSAAARALGVSRPTLRKRLKRFGIVTPTDPRTS